VSGYDEMDRNEQLKALGNGVVPQQAALALSVLHVMNMTSVPYSFRRRNDSGIDLAR